MNARMSSMTNLTHHRSMGLVPIIHPVNGAFKRAVISPRRAPPDRVNVGNFILSEHIVLSSCATRADAYNVRSFNGTNALQESQTWGNEHACLERRCSHVDSRLAVASDFDLYLIGSAEEKSIRNFESPA